MGSLADLMTQPFWVWLAVGVVLLAAEAATGSGWLLWPAASAGVVALLSVIGLPLGMPGQIAVFAILTVVTTFLARRYLVRAPAADPDINDQGQRLLGKVGEAREAFVDGRGRAFVNGAEWPADLESGGELKVGARVVVTAINGPRLTVKPA
ncbi:MAG: NfeD family protein [Proteobacteria bacterium]|nr:NfeD family protein [Pseudomonadota bacterium]